MTQENKPNNATKTVEEALNEVEETLRQQEHTTEATQEEQDDTKAQQVEETTDQEKLTEPSDELIDQLRAELAAAQKELSEQKDTVLRKIADAENMQRRAQGEIDKARKFALEKFAGELLPVVDNLERALAANQSENEAASSLIEGVELTRKSFMSVLEKFGISVIDPQGAPFNPDHHQAMSMQESTEVAPNTVIAVMQKGYLLNERLLRPAMVMVSKAASPQVDTDA